MLEVGQPGELPLMSELIALRKAKGLRDPSTVASRKSPVLEASPGIDELDLPLEESETDAGVVQNDARAGGSGRRDTRRVTVKKGSFRSQPLTNVDPRLSWDLGRETFVAMEPNEGATTDYHQRENFRSHLEKLGVLGETTGWGRQVGGKSLLHNWRAPNSVSDLETGDATARESTGQREPDSPNVMRHGRGARDTMRIARSWSQQSAFESHHAEAKKFVPFPEDAARVKGSLRASRNNGARQNGQILSPLVLNSRDDIQKFSQSQSLFTLEEPYNEEEQYLEEEVPRDSVAVQREASALKVGVRSQSPQVGSKDSRRSSNKPMNYSNTRPIDSSTQRPRSNLRPEPWEDGPEYQGEELELPRKSSRKSLQRSKNQKHVKNQSPGQDKILPLDSTKPLRRKDGIVADSEFVMQRGFASASYSPKNSQVEPLPFLTELEDYTGSDEFAGSSVDGDCGRLSKSKLHGELEIAFNASNRHYEGRLVQVADAQRLQLAVRESKELALCKDRPRNLSQKYRPKVFEEVVGQNIVTQALSNAISKGKIAPVYLFQGSRGTGKTSAARIFAAALICISPEEPRPCGSCRECISVASGKSSEVKEVDAASNNGIERVKALLQETICAPSLARYKVFIIDECHVLTTETWNALLKILEEPPVNVVFILITTDPDRLPRTAVSRCQKFPFPKIKDSEIVKRLRLLADLENLEIDADTLHLIASRSDGSLRDAETTLDQLSLLGQKINPVTVYELVGSASDERMVSLLDCALLADTVNTVRRARELVDSGVEPLALMSRLATLITDILAGSFKFSDKQRKGFFRRQTFSKEKLERLRMAMRTLSEAEKQLRVSNDRTTWLMAALLQLGPDHSFMFPASCVGTSVTQSPVALDDVGDNGIDFEHTSSGRQTWDDDANLCQNTSPDSLPTSKSETTSNGDNNHINYINSTEGNQWCMNRSEEMASAKSQVKNRSSVQSKIQQEPMQLTEKPQLGEGPLTPAPETLDGSGNEQLLSPRKLKDIWSTVVETCRPLPLRQLLYMHGKLLSISLSEVDAVVHLEFCHLEHKSRCERSQKNISNVFEAVLGFPVEVKVSLASLPAEETPGVRTVFPEEQSRSTDGLVNNGNVDHSENVALEGDSLNVWKNQGGVTKRAVAHQSNGSGCFPAIPHASSKDNACFEEASNRKSSSMPCSDKGGKPAHPLCPNTLMGEQQENAWTHEARRFSPLMSSACGDLIDAVELESELYQGGRRGQDKPSTASSYMQDLENDEMLDLSSEEQREVGELDLLSPESHEAATIFDEANLQRQSNIDGCLDFQRYSVDGRRSSDADCQKRKGSTMKMVRRLTMKSRIRSLPGSDPNSPDERGSYLRVPRFVSKSHMKSLKNKEGQLSNDAADTAEQAADSLEANSSTATQKRNKLKGAAGSFARFFQGKLTRQVTDAPSQ